MDVAPGQGVGHHHLPPLLIVKRLESHDVAEVGAVVVLRLHGLLTQTWKSGNNERTSAALIRFSEVVRAGDSDFCSAVFMCVGISSALSSFTC